MGVTVTVFTPTYNRAYIIENLYHSLQRQTCKDFEWLIVDDGSSDNTEEVIREWQGENNDFLIRYYKKSNGGKCRAINYGVDYAEGLLFFNVDSDDYLTNDAVEKVIKWEKTLPRDEKFCGVVGNLGTSETETPNTSFLGEYRDASLLERYPEYSNNPIDGERAPVFYTRIQKKYKYPEFDGERFMTPAVIWNRMANDGFKVRLFNDIIWIYEYQNDGITAQGNMNFIKNPQGDGLWSREKADFMGYSFKQRLKMWYSYYCEHSFCQEEYRLAKTQCAKYIGAPLLLVEFFSAYHKLKRK